MTEQTLIFSDLDGTLMDHYTYKSTEALPVIQQLNIAHIPIILTTSKTLAEVTKIQKNLEINAPLIIENGAAIFLPKSIFTQQPENTTEHDNYWVKSFCSTRQHWLELIANSPKKFKHLFKGFSTLSIEELSVITGLNSKDAALAKNRQYGEPIHWLGGEESKQAFIKYLENTGATVMHGGRFFHVSGESNKGKALRWLSQFYKNYFQLNNISTIALGDGDNDIAMLEAADIAVQIKSPVHSFPVLKKKENVIQTQYYGPVAWAKAIQEILPDLVSRT